MQNFLHYCNILLNKYNKKDKKNTTVPHQQVCVFDSNQKLEDVLAVQCITANTKKPPSREHLFVQSEEATQVIPPNNNSNSQNLHSALIGGFLGTFCVTLHYIS